MLRPLQQGIRCVRKQHCILRVSIVAIQLSFVRHVRTRQTELFNKLPEMAGGSE